MKREKHSYVLIFSFFHTLIFENVSEDDRTHENLPRSSVIQGVRLKTTTQFLPGEDDAKAARPLARGRSSVLVPNR